MDPSTGAPISPSNNQQSSTDSFTITNSIVGDGTEASVSLSFASSSPSSFPNISPASVVSSVPILTSLSTSPSPSQTQTQPESTQLSTASSRTNSTNSNFPSSSPLTLSSTDSFSSTSTLGSLSITSPQSPESSSIPDIITTSTISQTPFPFPSSTDSILITFSSSSIPTITITSVPMSETLSTRSSSSDSDSGIFTTTSIILPSSQLPLPTSTETTTTMSSEAPSEGTTSTSEPSSGSEESTFTSSTSTQNPEPTEVPEPTDTTDTTMPISTISETLTETTTIIEHTMTNTFMTTIMTSDDPIPTSTDPETSTFNTPFPLPLTETTFTSDESESNTIFSSSTIRSRRTTSTSTYTTTKYWTASYPSTTITYSTIVTIETGILSDDDKPHPGQNAFARNTGAIIGVSVAGAVVVLLLLGGFVWGCGRWRKRRFGNGGCTDAFFGGRGFGGGGGNRSGGSSREQLNFFPRSSGYGLFSPIHSGDREKAQSDREREWRPPLDDEDFGSDPFMVQRPNTSPNLAGYHNDNYHLPGPIAGDEAAAQAHRLSNPDSKMPAYLTVRRAMLSPQPHYSMDPEIANSYVLGQGYGSTGMSPPLTSPAGPSIRPGIPGEDVHLTEAIEAERDRAKSIKSYQSQQLEMGQWTNGSIDHHHQTQVYVHPPSSDGHYPPIIWNTPEPLSTDMQCVPTASMSAPASTSEHGTCTTVVGTSSMTSVGHTYGQGCTPLIPASTPMKIRQLPVPPSSYAPPAVPPPLVRSGETSSESESSKSNGSGSGWKSGILGKLKPKKGIWKGKGRGSDDEEQQRSSLESSKSAGMRRSKRTYSHGPGHRPYASLGSHGDMRGYSGTYTGYPSSLLNPPTVRYPEPAQTLPITPVTSAGLGYAYSTKEELYQYQYQQLGLYPIPNRSTNASELQFRDNESLDVSISNDGLLNPRMLPQAPRNRGRTWSLTESIGAVSMMRTASGKLLMKTGSARGEASEGGSVMSLRDYVDYSRPISSGAVLSGWNWERGASG